MPVGYTVEAGKLRDQVVLYAPKATNPLDVGGGQALQYETTGTTVWASVRPVTGQERMYAAHLSQSTTHLVIMRYWSGLTTSYKLVFRSRTFNIVGLRNIEERNRVWEVQCVEEGLS